MLSNGVHLQFLKPFECKCNAVQSFYFRIGMLIENPVFGSKMVLFLWQPVFELMFFVIFVNEIT